MKEFSLQCLEGPQALKFLDLIAELRITVFKEFPYSYDGNIEYEKKYLKNYTKHNRALIILAKKDDKIIGASTCIPMEYAEPAFSNPFSDAGYDPYDFMYYGESVILPEYRGKGIGKEFFIEREKHARKFKKSIATFCAVERNKKDYPQDYRPLDEFWRKQGFNPSKISTEFEWKMIHSDKPEKHKLNFWMKNLF
jgi:GNAT superfamily N-acetyltransferase